MSCCEVDAGDEGNHFRISIEFVYNLVLFHGLESHWTMESVLHPFLPSFGLEHEEDDSYLYNFHPCTVDRMISSP